MTPLHSSLALLPFLIACVSVREPEPSSASAPEPVPSSAAVPDADPYTGMYASPEGLIELHRAPDGSLRGYMRADDRIAALAPVDVRDHALHANATYDDGTRVELEAVLAPGPVLVVNGREFPRSAVEMPADAQVRREIEAAYAKLATAVETKDFAAFQALRVPEFATIPPDGVPSSAPRMAERARGLLERIQPPITTTNDILELTVRGDDAIATVRQEFTRMQTVDGTAHEIHSEVTQRETWTRTSDGWKLAFVDEVRDHVTLVDGQPRN